MAQNASDRNIRWFWTSTSDSIAAIVTRGAVHRRLQMSRLRLISTGSGRRCARGYDDIGYGYNRINIFVPK